METLTVGELKNAIKDMEDSDTVLIQRIEDYYFHNNGWTVLALPYEGNESQYINTHSAYKHNKMLLINAHY